MARRTTDETLPNKAKHLATIACSSRYALMHVMAFFLVFSRRKLLKPVE